jgi:hypothetical protein
MGSAGAEAGVIDEKIEPIRLASDCRGEAADLGEGWEVGGMEARGPPGRLDLVDDLLAPAAVAAMDEDAHSRFAEP